MSDTRGHEPILASHAGASTNAGLDPCLATHLLLATSESFHDVGPDVAVAFSPKHPLSLGSGHARPLAKGGERGPRFHTTRGLLAEIGKDPRFAKLRSAQDQQVVR